MSSRGSNTSGREPGSSTGRPIHSPRAASRSSTALPWRSSTITPTRPALADRARPRARPPSTIRSLKRGDRRARRAALVGELLELAAMIEREHVELVARRCAASVARCRCSSASSRSGARHRRRARQELVELDAARHRRRAAVAAHDERAAGVADRARIRRASPSSQPDEQPAEKRIAGAEHVQHFDRKSGASMPSPSVAGTRLRSSRSPSAPRLTTIGGGRALANRAQRARQVASLPPAMWISSSVPTTRSHSGRHPLQRRGDLPRTRRSASSPSPAAVSPHSTGR